MENNENLFQNPAEEPETVDESAVWHFDSTPEPEPDPDLDFEITIEEMESEQEDVIPTPVREPAKPPRKNRSNNTGKVVGICLLVAALVIIGCTLATFSIIRYREAQYAQVLAGLNQKIENLTSQMGKLEEYVDDNSFTGQGNSISGSPVNPDGMSPAKVHAQNKNAVVAIANQATTNIFGQATETASSGSGFLITADGYIVTNYHVIEGAQTLTVITNNAEEYPASVIGYDEGNDFAVIKIDVENFPFVTLGSSSDLIVGDQVVAIGNPLGEITNSLTVGYISVKDRSITIDNTIINMLQTDTAINPGNSGGPLFNMKGEVIGITTAKYSGTAVESIGFAIPIDDVADMIEDLLTDGFISAPYMGISITTQTDGMGVYVASVTPDLAAAKAGLKKGDIIVGLGEYETPTLASLDQALRHFEPNETTTIYVYRNRKILELSITFGVKPANP